MGHPTMQENDTAKLTPTPDAGIISPTNGSSWNWWKIKIKDYQKEPYKRVIL